MLKSHSCALSRGETLKTCTNFKRPPRPQNRVSRRMEVCAGRGSTCAIVYTLRVKRSEPYRARDRHLKMSSIVPIWVQFWTNFGPNRCLTIFTALPIKFWSDMHRFSSIGALFQNDRLLTLAENRPCHHEILNVEIPTFACVGTSRGRI